MAADVNRVVRIERHWADVFGSLREAQQIAKSVNPEFDLLYERIRQFLKDCFVETAQEYVVARWEKIVNIIPRASDTLEERRNRVLYQMNIPLPYTTRRLKHLFLANIVGEGNYKVTVDPIACTIEVLLNPAKETMWDDVEQLLDTMLPAHIEIKMGFMGTIHNYLKNYTHNELSAFSHDEIRDTLMFINNQ